MFQMTSDFSVRDDNPILVIHDRAAYLGAIEMIRKHGEDAVLVASAEADRNRDSGNVLQSSFWRSIEIAIQIIQLDDIYGEVH